MTTTDRLRALLAEATPGPWTLDRGSIAWMIRERPDGPQVANAIIEDDAALIVAAANALPALLDVVEAAERLSDGAEIYEGFTFGSDSHVVDEEDLATLRAALAKLDLAAHG